MCGTNGRLCEIYDGKMELNLQDNILSVTILRPDVLKSVY